MNDVGFLRKIMKQVLVTGGNAGIGLATCHGLADHGASVVLVCRDPARGEQAAAAIRRASGNDDVHLLCCDLSSLSEVRQLSAEVTAAYPGLDLLINNAAMYTGSRVVTVDGFEAQFATNYLSMFLLTRLLLDTLTANAPARIVNLSTVNHFDVSLDLDDLQSERSWSPKLTHIRSKLAVILFTYELARRIEGTGVTANCLHPGVIATNLLGQVRNVPPDRRVAEVMGGDPLAVGARTPLYLATSSEVEGVSGRYFDDCSAVRSSDETYDEQKAARLWEISESLTQSARIPLSVRKKPSAD